MKEMKEVSHAVFHITGDHSLLELDQEVTSLAVGCEVLAIALCNQHSYLIQLYLLTELHSGRNKLPLQTYILQRQLPTHHNDQGSYGTHHNYTEEFHYGSKERSRDRSEVMAGVKFEDRNVSLHLVTTRNGNVYKESFSSVLEISKDIFQALCGFQLSLLNSPLLLICPPEGSVYYAPIKSPDTEAGTVRLFCHTHYPVVGVGKLDLKVADIKDPLYLEVGHQDKQTGLVVTSQDGRALLATLSEGNAGKFEFVEIALPGPVLDVDSHGNKIYHSSGMDVYESVLETKPQPAGLSCHIAGLMYAGAQELACLHDNNCTQGGECDLLLGTHGLPLKLIKPEGRHKRGRKAAGTGQTIRNLLHSINICSEEMEELKKQQSCQTDRLAQINMAAFLSTQDPQSPDFPLRFSYSISPRDGQSRQNSNWVFNCHMTNTSDIHFSSDWMVMIVLSDNKQEFVSSSFPLPHGLGAATGMEFQTVLLDSSLLLPLIVKISLVLHSTNSTVIQPVINVPVSSTTLDILYGLVTPQDVISLTSATPEVSITQLVKDIAVTQPIARCNELPLAPTPTTLTVQIPDDVLKSDQVAIYRKDPCPLLSFLLRSSSVVQKDNSVSVVTVGGHEVRLAAEDHTLTIHSDRAHVAIATRQAIQNRLQVCRGDVQYIGDRREPQLVNSLQHLQDKLSDLHSRNSCAKDLSRNKVLDIYKTLRSTPMIKGILQNASS
ncbi:uncharacterized protein [Argopecten irradians]